MVAHTASSIKSSQATADALGVLLKRPWDPVFHVYSQQKPVSDINPNCYVDKSLFQAASHLHISTVKCKIFPPSKLSYRYNGEI